LPHLPIGKRFTANLGCPTFVFSKRLLHQRPSVQISHAYLPPGDDGFVVESWFGPPGTIAIAMPGYLQTHAERMSKYANITAIAPLVGAEPLGTIELDGARPKVRIPPNPKDLERLKKGSAFIAQTVLDSQNDALDMILLGTRTGFEIRSKQDIAAFLGAVQHRWQLRLGSGHPQGGNAMSQDAALSVVDGNFRVRGVANLRVCDASVFPDGAGVNPQWTVMALAHLCGASL
jgi:choline dehydrogenase-like flavoprotein